VRFARTQNKVKVTLCWHLDVLAMLRLTDIEGNTFITLRAELSCQSHAYGGNVRVHREQ
jgi:hypothetical protein